MPPTHNEFSRWWFVYMFVSFGTPSRPRTRWMIPVGLRWFTGSNHLDRMENMSWNWKLSLSLYIYLYVYESNTFKLYCLSVQIHESHMNLSKTWYGSWHIVPLESIKPKLSFGRCLLVDGLRSCSTWDGARSPVAQVHGMYVWGRGVWLKVEICDPRLASGREFWFVIVCWKGFDWI